jgi:hypothetical protein
VDDVDQLAQNYYKQYQWSQPDVRSGFDHLYRKYVHERQQDIVDAIAVGLTLQAIMGGNEIDVAAMPDNIKEAFHTAFPNLDIESLNDRSKDEIEGLMNAWNGKLFEIEVRDQLNAGIQVGDMLLEPGQKAVLAESATQVGWDLKIINEDGTDSGLFLQLKATDSASYINQALERYPDVPIIATSEMLGHNDDAVSMADVSSDHLRDQIGNAVNAGNSASDVIMGSALIIALTEVFQVMTRKKSVEVAIENGVKRGWLSVIAGTAGSFATFLGGPLLGIPVGVITRIYLANAMNDTKPNVIHQPEKVINPYPEFSKAETHSTRNDAKQAFRELEQVTGRLLLEYDGR